MKQFSVLVFTIFVVANSFAQVKEGSIVYEKKMNMHRRITDEQMRAYIPEFRSSKHMLYFSDSISNYKPLVELESNEGGEGGRMIMTMGASMMGETTDLFKNYSKATATNIIEFGSNTYNVTDSIKKQNWIFQNEVKNILGYNCKKAVFKQMQPVRKAMRMSFGMGGDNETKKDTAASDTPKFKEIEVKPIIKVEVQTEPYNRKLTEEDKIRIRKKIAEAKLKKEEELKREEEKKK
jgi:GLPGLI family protein